MFRKYSLAVIAMSFLAGSTLAAQVRQNYPHDRHGRDRWLMLGQKRIEGRIDNDRIDLGSRAGEFRSLQFRVEDGDVRFQRILVTFGNGQTAELPLRATIPSGGRSRAIDLPGDRRVINSIAMWYRKFGPRSHPTVTVYGMR